MLELAVNHTYQFRFMEPFSALGTEEYSVDPVTGATEKYDVVKGFWTNVTEHSKEVAALSPTSATSDDARREEIAKRQQAILSKMALANKGLYIVQEILSMLEVQTLGIKFLIDTYTVVGSGEDLYKADYPKLKSLPILKLQSIQDPSKIYYISTYYVQAFPEFKITEYPKLMLMVDLGTFASTVHSAQQYIGVTKKIQDIIQAEFGFADGGNPQLSTYGSVWMTDESYALLEEWRELEKTRAESYYSQCLKKDSEIASLKAQVDQLQSMLKP